MHADKQPPKTYKSQSMNPLTEVVLLAKKRSICNLKSKVKEPAVCPPLPNDVIVHSAGWVTVRWKGQNAGEPIDIPYDSDP